MQWFTKVVSKKIIVQSKSKKNKALAISTELAQNVSCLQEEKEQKWEGIEQHSYFYANKWNKHVKYPVNNRLLKPYISNN